MIVNVNELLVMSILFLYLNFRTPVLKLFSFLYPKEKVPLQLHVNGELIEDLTPPMVNEQPTESQTTESFSQGNYLYILIVYCKSRIDIKVFWHI